MLFTYITYKVGIIYCKLATLDDVIARCTCLSCDNAIKAKMHFLNLRSGKDGNNF